MSYIDAETGAETAGLLKSPAVDNKKSTRGLTALVVAAAALSFFAGAAAATHAQPPRRVVVSIRRTYFSHDERMVVRLPGNENSGSVITGNYQELPW